MSRFLASTFPYHHLKSSFTALGGSTVWIQAAAASWFACVTNASEEWTTLEALCRISREPSQID